MTYRAGIIGAGGIAGLGILGLHDEADIGEKKFPESHAGGYHTTNDIELVAVADTDEHKANRFADAWDLPASGTYGDHTAMLSNEALDLVSVCTPTFLHAEHVIDAAKSSANPSIIWCEKPIASSVSEASRMSEVCDETDTELVINHIFRFSDKMQRLHEQMQSGLIGDVKAINAQFRRELMRNSTHLLDSIIFLQDARAKQVSGYINGENDAVDALGGTPVDDAGGGGFVLLDDGTFVTVDCTVEREISSMGIQFIGTEGKLSINNDDGEWRYWRLDDGDHVEASIPNIDGGWNWETDFRDAFAIAANHLVDLIEYRTENHSSGQEALQSVEIILGLYISHYTRSHVDLPLDRPLQDVAITSW